MVLLLIQVFLSYFIKCGYFVLYIMGKKIPMEGVTEKNCGAETEGKTTQRLPYLGIFPIYSHQTQTLLWIPARAC
jgi:hypothetical protein